MINKIYEKVINFIKEYRWFLLFFMMVFICDNIYLPYYIEAPGGLADASDKLVISDGYESKGSFNMAYVSEYQVNIPLYLYSFFNKEWDLVSKKEANAFIDEEAMDIQSHLMMQSSISNATLVSFKFANVPYKIISTKNYVSYITQESKTDLVVGDEILEVNGLSITKLEDISKIVNDLQEGDTVYLKVLDKNKIEVMRYAVIYTDKDKKYIGISIETINELETELKVINNISKNESGPSGGLMMSLSLYNSLVEEDITHGYKIAGTGTIDEDGNVGEIGGIKYKIKGAVKNKADLFLVPKANYAEAKKVIEENNYTLKLVSVDTFSDALKYLDSIDTFYKD